MILTKTKLVCLFFKDCFSILHLVSMLRLASIPTKAEYKIRIPENALFRVFVSVIQYTFICVDFLLLPVLRLILQ